MTERTGYANEPVRNKAQEEREADSQDPKPFTDTPQLEGGETETWEQSTGHSGTRHAWTVSLAMVASFLLAGAGMTFGPRLLLWIGAGLFVVLGIYSLATHAWTDYAHDQTRPEHS
jgi:peptidoglycan/LPS O-acetylase OafA/YrhL